MPKEEPAGNGVLVTLAVSGAIFLLGVALYFIIRPYNSKIFHPRKRKPKEGTRTGWMSVIFRERDEEEISSRGGLMGILYLRLSKYLIYYMLIVSVISVAVVFPLNYFVGGEGSNVFEQSVGNSISGKSLVFLCHTILIIIFNLMGWFIIWWFQRQYIELSRAHVNKGGPHTYTINISNIPRRVTQQGEL